MGWDSDGTGTMRNEIMRHQAFFHRSSPQFRAACASGSSVEVASTLEKIGKDRKENNFPP